MYSNLEILFIEDQADDRDLICHLLNKHMDDIHITCEDNKEDVMTLLNNKHFDLIITDYYLSGYTGFELIDEIRALKGFDIPIIMITGDETEDVSLKAINHGVDDFIIKTFKGIKDLPTVIRRTLKRADIHKIKYTSENRIIDTGEIFQNIYENASELIFTLWPDTTFVNVNEATLNALGINRQDIGVKNFVGFIDSSNRGKFKSALNQLFDNQAVTNFELVLKNSNDKIVNVIGDGHPHLVNGKVVAVNWIFRNITSEKYVENLIWDDYKQYSGIFNYIPVAVMLSDHRGVILQANTAACSLTGYKLAELQGIHIRDITHPDDIEMSIEYHKKLMAGQLESYTIEKRYKHKSGSDIWVEVSASLVKNSKGGPLYGIAHIKDISDLKHFEELLGKLAQDLTRVKGEYIFDRLSARLIDLLQSDYVFISSINQETSRYNIHTLLFRDKIKNLQEPDFNFPNELLDELIAEDELIIANHLTRKGKRTTAFDEQSSTDLVAIPLRNEHGKVIGILGTIYTQATHNHSIIKTLLRIAGSKISDQLENQESKPLINGQDDNNNSQGSYSIN